MEPTPTGIYNPVVGRFGFGEGYQIIAELIGRILNLAFMIGGVVLLAMIIISGIQWMTAGGDKQALSSAQGRLTSAIVGFIILASAFAIINFIGNVLNIEFLQARPGLPGFRITWPAP